MKYLSPETNTAGGAAATDAGASNTAVTDAGASTVVTTDAGASSTAEPKPTTVTAPAERPEEVLPYFASAPDDWRKEVAGEEKGLASWLDRYSDPQAALKAGFSAQEKIRKNELSTGLPENPSDEVLAAYREANGIPESPDKYLDALDDGLVLGENDKAVMNLAYEAAHKHNIPAAAMAEITNNVLKAQQEAIDLQVKQDGVDQVTATKMLKEMWGGDMEPNLNLMQNLLSSRLSSEVLDGFMGARMHTGEAIFNNPEVVSMLVDIARSENPAATLMPGSTNPQQAIDDEIAELSKQVGTDEWFKDDIKRERYKSLLEAKAASNA